VNHSRICDTCLCKQDYAWHYRITIEIARGEAF
jgi:hypothetical protein